MTFLVASVLENRYRIEQRLGHGGMGAVYRAYDTRLQQTVAIKENTVAMPGISPDTIEAARRQFEQEALVLARARHPNLPRVSDHFVTSDGNQYLVMDFIEGQDLAHIIARSGPLPEAQALAWIDQVCHALEYLHSQQPPIIHRDIKPQNIKVTPNGQVFLVDFGIAKLGSASIQTTPGALSVTTGFSPPEQYAMTGTDARTDIYALGATLYALLTGQVPPDSISLQSGESQLVPPRQVNADISPDLQQAVLKAMAARRTDRPQTVAEFRRMLSIHQVEHSDTVTLTASAGDQRPAPEGTLPSARPVRANPWWRPVLVGAGVVALVLMAVLVWRGRNVPPALAPTQTAAQPAATLLPAARPAATTVLLTERPTATLPPTAWPTAVAVSPTSQPTQQPVVVATPPRTPEQVDAIDLTGKSITVTFWHAQSQRNQTLLQSMLDEFNRTNPFGVHARAEIAGTTYTDLYNKVNVAMMAGASPELSMAFQSQAAVYRSKGAVVDLTPLIKSNKYGLSQADLDDVFPVMLDGDVNPVYPDERLGFPMQRAMDVLYYNSDWLKQLGYNAPPKDWKLFEEMACKAVDRGKNKSGWAFHHDASNFATFVIARGGRLLAEDAQAYLFNSEAGLDAVKTIQRMFEQGCAVDVPTSERFGEETRFANGQVLFVFASSSSLSFYADAVNKAGKFRWNIAMPPYDGKPVVDLYGPNMVVHKTTPEKELAAWLVIRFLSDKTQTARWSIETGYLPVRKSAKDNMLSGMRADKYYGPVADLYNKLFDWMSYAVTEPPVAGFDSVRYSIDRDVISKIILDPKADVKALLDAAVNRANDTLK